MRRIGCREARRWMQVPADLNVLEKRELQAHLDICSECQIAGEQYRHVDQQIETWLQSQKALTSVRTAVLERIAEDARPVERFHWKPILTPFRLAVIVPLALTAVLLMLTLPAIAPGRNRSPATASAAWRLVRPFVGFPLAVDPRRPNHLLAGAWGRVYESWTAGSTWHALAPLPKGLIIRDLLIDAAHSRHFLVAAKHSVYSSSVGGRHWIRSLAWEPGS